MAGGKPEHLSAPQQPQGLTRDQLAEFAALGMPPELVAEHEALLRDDAGAHENHTIYLDEQGHVAVGVFQASATQWRWISPGMARPARTGFDYPAVQLVARVLGAKWTRALFADLQIMEAASLGEWAAQARAQAERDEAARRR